MSDPVAELSALVEAFEGHVEVVDDLRGDPALRVDREMLHDVVARLKEDGYEKCVLVTAVDNYLEEPRFEVIYVLRSLARNTDVRLNVPVPGENPEVATITDLYATADWLERETYDMFGVRFEGHPNLERILMWEGFEGHPLRKDYPLLGNTPGTPGYRGKGGRP
ncbi:MAG: NADH-quinone oxidoreductase subunit C [Planctomycetota bacterium]